MEEANSLISVFLRYPEAGKTKTRLIPELGPAGAAWFYRKLAEHCVNEVRRSGVASLLNVEPSERLEDCRQWIGQNFSYVAQTNGPLGERLIEASRYAFEECGTSRLVVIGTDCPAVSAEVLTAAVEALSESEVVFGPALDGGYYLVGTRQHLPVLFSDIPWSSDDTLSASIRKLEELGLSYTLLPELSDIDYPKDVEAYYPEWEAQFNQAKDCSDHASIWA